MQEPKSASSSAATAARPGICRRMVRRTCRWTRCSGWARRWWPQRTAAGCSRPTPAAPRRRRSPSHRRRSTSDRPPYPEAARLHRITVTNSGGLPLTIYAVALDAAGGLSYSIASSSCSGTLAVGQSCRLDVVFRPRETGGRAASIRLITNASNSEVSIPLHGVGAAPPPAPNALLAPWTADDVGATGVVGSAGSSARSIVVKGGGADIWDAADAFPVRAPDARRRRHDRRRAWQRCRAATRQPRPAS